MSAGGAGPRRLAACILALAAWWVPAEARGEAKLVVAVEAEGANTARVMAARVGRELELRGFTVVDRTADRSGVAPSITALTAEARAIGAVLALRVRVAADGSAQLEAIDRVTGKRLQRDLAAVGAHGPSSVALAAAELVDASLIELELPQRTAAGEMKPPADLPRPRLRARRSQGYAEASTGVLWPVRSPVPLAVGVLAFGIRPASRFGLAVEGTIPLHALAQSHPIASVRSRPFLAALRADVDLAPQASRVRLDLQLALAAQGTRIDVDAAPGARGRPTTAWTAAALGGLALRVPIGLHASVGATARLAVPFEDFRILVADRVVQRFGPVWIGFAVTAGARW